MLNKWNEVSGCWKGKSGICLVDITSQCKLKNDFPPVHKKRLEKACYIQIGLGINEKDMNKVLNILNFIWKLDFYIKLLMACCDPVNNTFAWWENIKWIIKYEGGLLEWSKLLVPCIYFCWHTGLYKRYCTFLELYRTNKNLFLLSLLVQSYNSTKARTPVSNVGLDLAELLPLIYSALSPRREHCICFLNIRLIALPPWVLVTHPWCLWVTELCPLHLLLVSCLCRILCV